MSLHLFPETRMSPNPTENNSPSESDSDYTPPGSTIWRLEEELRKERAELARTKAEKRELASQLQLAQDDIALLEQKCEEHIRALHKASHKINELETFRDKSEGDIAEMNACLKAAYDRTGRLNVRLESSEKECSRLNLEKSLWEDKTAELEEEVRQLRCTALNDNQLLAELEQQRIINLDLKRDLVAAREKGHRSLAGIEDEEDSPDRMIFDQFDQRKDGMNLRQELIMLGSPLTATCSRSVQFPNSEDILEGHAVDVAVISATCQTENVVVTDSSTQIEVLSSKAVSSQTRETLATHVNEGGLLLAVPVYYASMQVQTDSVPPTSCATVSTQTPTSSLRNRSTTANGTAATLQPLAHQSRGNPSPNFSPPTFLPSSEPNHVGYSSTYKGPVFWIWALAVLGLVLAIISNGGRIDITPIVNSCKSGLKFHHKKGMPPH